MASSLCRVCLIGNTNMVKIDDTRLLEMYEIFTNTQLHTERKTGMPSRVCYDCHQQLQRCYSFCCVAQNKSKKIVQDPLKNGPEVSHKTVTKLCPETSNLSVIPAQHILYSNTRNTPEDQVSNVTDDIDLEEINSETLDEDVEIGNISENSELTPENEDNLSNDPKTKRSFFYCDVCNTNMTTKNRLIKHLQLHIVEKKYVCNVCNMELNHKRNVAHHMLIHTGKKPYSCGMCKKAFSKKSNLTRHMLVHSGNKPYSCNGCKMAFSLKSNLKSHMLIHTGEKPYSCDQCGKAFSHRSTLTSHMLDHIGKKPYSCNRCDLAFIYKSYLTRHMQVHAGELPYSCNRYTL